MEAERTAKEAVQLRPRQTHKGQSHHARPANDRQIRGNRRVPFEDSVPEDGHGDGSPLEGQNREVVRRARKH